MNEAELAAIEGRLAVAIGPRAASSGPLWAELPDDVRRLIADVRRLTQRTATAFPAFETGYEAAEAKRQQAPKPGREEVHPRVVAFLNERAAFGRRKYDRPLETHNGRDPLVDLMQELGDALEYAMQEHMERADRACTHPTEYACEAALQAAKDRASTSYREGYEAGRAAYAYETRNSGPPGVLLGAKPTLEEIKAAAERARIPPGTWEDGQGRIHESALDPKALNIWEMADMLASLTASMRGLADALVEAERRREAAERDRDFRAADAAYWRDRHGLAARAAEAGEKRQGEIWRLVGETDKLREQLRLLTKERDEWREEAMAFRREGGHGVSVPKINLSPEN